MVTASPRFRDLLELVVRARAMTSVPVLRAYSSVYSPDLWIALSKTTDGPVARSYEGIAQHFRDYACYSAIQRVANRISIDLGAFDRIITQVHGAPSITERHERRLDVHLLHAIRQAVMMQAWR